MKIKRYVVEYEKDLLKVLTDADSQAEVLKIHNYAVTGRITNLEAVKALTDLYERRKGA